MTFSETTFNVTASKMRCCDSSTKHNGAICWLSCSPQANPLKNLAFVANAWVCMLGDGGGARDSMLSHKWC